MSGFVENSVTTDWKIRKNDKLEARYQKSNIVEAVGNKRLK